MKKRFLIPLLTFPTGVNAEGFNEKEIDEIIKEISKKIMDM